MRICGVNKTRSAVFPKAVSCRMKWRAVLVCVWLLVAVVSAQEEEGEKAEKTASGPKKPPFREPSYPEGDVYFVETFTDAKKVWKRFDISRLSVYADE